MGRHVPELEAVQPPEPVLSPAPVIETSAKPVNPVVKALVAGSGKRPTQKPKSGYSHSGPTTTAPSLTN